MTQQDRLWLSGFTTVSQVLAHDRLAIAEVQQALDGGLRQGPALAGTVEGRLQRGNPRELRELTGGFGESAAFFRSGRVETGRAPHL